MRLDTELFQAVIEVQQAVAAAGLDSATVMRVIAERSRALTGATRRGDRGDRGRRARTRCCGSAVESPRLQRGREPVRRSRVRTGELQRSRRHPHRPAHRAPGLPRRRASARMLVGPAARRPARSSACSRCFRPRPAAFSDRDAKALRLLGGLVGASLEHAAAFEARQARLEERTRALQESEQRFKQLVDVAQEGHLGRRRPRASSPTSTSAWPTCWATRTAPCWAGRSTTSSTPRPAPARSGRWAGRGASGESHDLRFRRQDGTELWGLVSASPISGRDGALVGTVGMVTDITERKRTEERLRRSAERLAMLHDLDQAILAARSPAEIGRAALGRMRRMVPCHRCTRGAVRLPARPGAADRRVSPAGSPIPPRLDAAGPALARRGAAPRRGAHRSTTSPRSNRRRRSSGSSAARACAASSASRSWWTARPSARSTWPRARRAGFTAEHRDIALEVAAPLAIAIQQARLREELGRQTGELERRVAERGAALRAATRRARDDALRRLPRSARAAPPHLRLHPAAARRRRPRARSRPSSTTPGGFATAPAAWPAWWTTWCSLARVAPAGRDAPAGRPDAAGRRTW